MKKRVTAISALILVVVLAAALVACVDDGDTNVGPFTYDIGSAIRAFTILTPISISPARNGPR